MGNVHTSDDTVNEAAIFLEFSCMSSKTKKNHSQPGLLISARPKSHA